MTNKIKFWGLDEYFEHSQNVWDELVKPNRRDMEVELLQSTFTPEYEFTDEEWLEIQVQVDDEWEREQYKERGYIRNRKQIEYDVIQSYINKKGG